MSREIVSELTLIILVLLLADQHSSMGRIAQLARLRRSPADDRKARGIACHAGWMTKQNCLASHRPKLYPPIYRFSAPVPTHSSCLG
jgi:hypothetical protein